MYVCMYVCMCLWIHQWMSRSIHQKPTSTKDQINLTMKGWATLLRDSESKGEIRSDLSRQDGANQFRHGNAGARYVRQGQASADTVKSTNIWMSQPHLERMQVLMWGAFILVEVCWEVVSDQVCMYVFVGGVEGRCDGGKLDPNSPWNGSLWLKWYRDT